ncbi:hypothetical protein NPIL_180521 [Nephila pilipes]|uniref:Uncharacterized protein n=1 Tax=Nephila pilipes TaxID=299642 RepID=A0A8X6N3B3_NEPPI|nr:hypothetical protein NPIL_180521 [Nephila pilipes]
MCQLAADKVKDFLKSLWLNQLPKHSQTILVANSEPFDNLATIADKIHGTFEFQNILNISQERSQTTASEINIFSLVALEIQELKTSQSRSANCKFSCAEFHRSKSRSNICGIIVNLARKPPYHQVL